MEDMKVGAVYKMKQHIALSVYNPPTTGPEYRKGPRRVVKDLSVVSGSNVILLDMFRQANCYIVNLMVGMEVGETVLRRDWIDFYFQRTE